MKSATKYAPPLLSFLLVILLTISAFVHYSDPVIPSSLKRLNIQGNLSFVDVKLASRDFGNQCEMPPSAVLYPSTVADISTLLEAVYGMGNDSKVRVAARGHGHSLSGQAQALGGIVIHMESLREQEIEVHAGKDPYVDVSGGSLWIDILKETLKYELAPKAWTDYLYLTVGGTLSNAGISGQTFRHGPQISNVLQLEIVTGKGEIVNCSSEQHADLFFAALGGLGQFGVITRARIPLEPAPKMVRWTRVLYSNFTSFAEDQEMLISAEKSFDYVEGFVIKNRTGLLNNWRSFLNPQDPLQANQFKSEGKTLYCLEMTENFDPDEEEPTNQETNSIMSQLQYIPSTLFQSQVSYLEFLNRVYLSEMKLRSRGLWDVPHPWINLFIPATRVKEFAEEVFGNIIADSSDGPILIYPVNKSKWDNRTSAVIPDEEIFYLVAFLTSVSSTSDHDRLKFLLEQNKIIVEYCKKVGIKMKQYLPHHNTVEEWKDHFGERWELFLRRKLAYDPLAILAPGQGIFQKADGITRQQVYDDH